MTELPKERATKDRSDTPLSIARDRPSDWWSPLAAGGVGFVTFALSLGLTLVNPSNIAWLVQGGDPSIHFFGWHLYRHASWTLPLGAVPLWSWPVGTSVGLTDSIPLLAIPLKVVDGALPTYFQFVGLWLLAAFVLQGVFGALIMRQLTHGRVLQVLGACLLVMSPPMIARHGHAALTAHWLILGALWLYVRMTTFAPFVAWWIISTLAAATHPYLAVMVSALMLAAHSRELMHQRRWLPVTSRVLALFVWIGVVFWQVGYFVVSPKDLQAQGFGFHSMNLLAPVMPLSAYGAVTGPFRPATAGQYEGYAYLGMGIMLAAIVALVSMLRSPGSLKQRLYRHEHLPLALLLSVLLLHALGPAITLGPLTLAQYNPSLWGPLQTFRASGRMVWPLYYTLVIVVLAGVVRLRERHALRAMVAAVVLQAVDASSVYAPLRDVRNIRFENPLSSDFWQAAPRHYRRIVLFPTSMCGSSETVDHRPFALIAGREGIGINAGAAARPDVGRLLDYCRSLQEDATLGHLDPQTLYVFRRDLTYAVRAVARDPALCMTIDGHGVCVATPTVSQWQDDFDPMFSVFPSLAELIDFYATLNEEYATLERPETPVSGPTPQRLKLLARYLWYRRGGCAHDLASERVLQPSAGELRICGDPFGAGEWPSVDDTFRFRLRLETSLRSASAPVAPTRVDAEGEAVWLQKYLTERLGGRDAYGARVEVQNAIRPFRRPSTR